MKVIVKGNEQELNDQQIGKDYQQFQISEEDFDEIIRTIRKAVIASKVIKSISLLKDFITKISEIRSKIEYNA